MRSIYGGDYSELTDSSSVEGAIAETQLLRERLAEHEHALRRYQNTLVPINRLPAELISHIFRYCGPFTSCIQWRPLPEEKTPSFGFSRVCRRWRSVALNDPTIWTNPTCANRFMAQELPARARGLPLDVNMILLENASARKVVLAKELATHFRSFSRLLMEVDDPSHLEAVVGAFSAQGTPPHLKLMHLQSGNPVILPYNGAWTLSPSAIVTLSNCLFPLESHFLQELETLNIRVVLGYRPLRVYGIADVLSMLRRNTAIQSLSLVRVLKRDRGTVHYLGHSGVLRLPKLEDIELEGDPSTVLHLLKKLDLPALNGLYIIHARADVWTNLVTINPFLGYLRGLLFARRGILSSLGCSGEDCGGTLDFRTTLPGAETMSELSVGLWYQSQEPRKDFPGVLEMILPCFSLNDLTSLSVHEFGETENDTRVFWQLFSSLPCLREIEITQDCEAVYGFLNELNEESTFPALTRLTFEYVGMGYVIPERGQSTFMLLASVLKHRGTTGLPNLEEVRVWNCYEDKGQVRPSEDELEEIPVNIEVD